MILKQPTRCVRLIQSTLYPLHTCSDSVSSVKLVSSAMCARSLAPGILMPRHLSGSCARAEMWSQACACCRTLDASSGA